MAEQTQTYDKDDKRKYLDFLQGVITRMNGNSFLIKGWAITLITALFALAAKDARYDFVYIGAIAVPIFWGLDAYYLSLEKRYRDVYEKFVANTDGSKIPYNMKLDPTWGIKHARLWWLYCLVNKTIWPVYGAIIGISYFVLNLLTHKSIC